MYENTAKLEFHKLFSWVFSYIALCWAYTMQAMQDAGCRTGTAERLAFFPYPRPSLFTALYLLVSASFYAEIVT